MSNLVEVVRAFPLLAGLIIAVPLVGGVVSGLFRRVLGVRQSRRAAGGSAAASEDGEQGR